MAQQETKRMKITPLKCVLSDRKTSRGSKIYNLVFKPEGADIEMTAVTFSDTVAAEFEKRVGQEPVEAEFQIGEYQGSPSYTMNEIAGIKKSGFVKGQGFQRDVVSEERKAAASVAVKLMELDKKAIANPIKGWEKIADQVYAWISKRPSEPEAAGGKTEQVPPGGDEDAPAEQ